MEIKVERLSDSRRKELKIPGSPQNANGWSVWECDPSSFDWNYSDREEAYVFEGTAKVRTANGEIEFGQGDFVTFPRGLSCHWQVLEKIRKVYRFQ